MTTAVGSSLLAPVDAEPSGAPRSETDDHPHRRAILIAFAGYVAITVALLGIGMLLTHPLDHSVGRWDEHVNEYFARNRTATWNDITQVATASFNTVPVVAAAALVVGFLSLRRYFREAAFLTLALLLEITVFLSVTFVVARPRPDVIRLNSTPATSSFPSGHTAAATVLFVGIAVIVTSCTTNRLARVFSAFLALVVATAVGFARVYRGLHHPTDVFVGVVFGLACLVVAAMAIRAHDHTLLFRSERVAKRAHPDFEHALQR